MSQAKPSNLFQRMDEYELVFCRRFNSACCMHPLEQIFVLVSRLGDGILWYALIALLPLLYGTETLVASAHRVLVGALGIFIYK